jgi:hypothetical protein
LDNVPKYTDVTDALALAIAHSYIMRSRVWAARFISDTRSKGWFQGYREKLLKKD